ncbi:suppressor of Mek1 [Anastrepha obliqua]|uniref:suppressor of Mek1 n=1 Tax=Anastrepha obliqua TaxID=95512 RepID=UPI002409DBE0|nr:suppressor of Mek1 [Anastrepha obliqua]
MKFLVGLLFASVALGGVLGLPAGSPNDDAEIIEVPRRQVLNPHSTDDSVDSSGSEPEFTDFKGVIDTGVGYPFLQPHPLPFSFNLGFFDAFEDIFRRLRNQLWSSSLPSDGDSLSSFDSSKGNTTSTVKIVDGHKVEVNETVYGDGDNLFKVRLVNIRPIDSDEYIGEAHEPNANPVTSGPKKSGYDNESNERREPLEPKSDENEIRGHIDEPEVKHTQPQQPSQFIHETMLPVTNEDNAANLNTSFVSDNSLEVAEGKESSEQSSEEEIAEVVEIDGNIEAETNKSVNNSDEKEKMEILENSTAIPAVEEKTLGVTQNDVLVHSAEDHALTIENNEEMEANNNSNESSNSDILADAPAAENKTNAEAVENQDDLRAELDEEDIEEETTESAGIEEVTESVKSVDDLAEWVGDETVAAPGEGNDEINNHPNKQPYNKNREDVSSSDDEQESETVEMNPEFDSEWADLKEDLAKKGDERNDFSNDIDAYDALPVDLSNDIAVNDLVAGSLDFPINPDAEVISVPEIQTGGGLPKFEKLKISEATNPSSYEVASILESDK